MSWTIVIIIAVVAGVAYFLYKQRGDKAPDAVPSRDAGRVPGAALAASPPAAPSAQHAAAGPAASHDEYRRTYPSNMRGGKLTCNQCGSTLLRTAAGLASCTSCGSSLYRA
ncbi:hypothetical protein [Methylibium sp.]|uniref:hypothetical protein n=1 Tax=Methylibium sp. TaxID=2067992 RepID=UPI00286AE9B8|nr:hypothetical protein [Methylibium sp.]